MLSYKETCDGKEDYNVGVFNCSFCPKCYFSFERLVVHIQRKHTDKVSGNNDLIHHSVNNLKSQHATTKVERRKMRQTRLVKNLVKNWPPEKAFAKYVKRYGKRWTVHFRYLTSRNYSSETHDKVDVQLVLQNLHDKYTYFTPSQITSIEHQTGLSKYSIKMWLDDQNCKQEPTEFDYMMLEEFMQNSYPCEEKIKELARVTGRDYSSINTWFILQRAKSNKVEFKETKEKVYYSILI